MHIQDNLSMPGRHRVGQVELIVFHEGMRCCPTHLLTDFKHRGTLKEIPRGRGMSDCMCLKTLWRFPLYCPVTLTNGLSEPSGQSNFCGSMPLVNVTIGYKQLCWFSKALGDLQVPCESSANTECMFRQFNTIIIQAIGSQLNPFFDVGQGWDFRQKPIPCLEYCPPSPTEQ